MASPEQSTTASPRPTRVHAQILLIDDQRCVGVPLARLLAGEPGLELHCCERGAEAEAAADRIRPALILQDLVMPDVDGPTLVQAFRQRAAPAPTPAPRPPPRRRGAAPRRPRPPRRRATTPATRSTPMSCATTARRGPTIP